MSFEMKTCLPPRGSVQIPDTGSCTDLREKTRSGWLINFGQQRKSTHDCKAMGGVQKHVGDLGFWLASEITLM